MRFALFLATFLAFAGSAFAEPRIALVIGNSRYGGDLGNLANPANDARLMAKTLRSVGFDVIETQDANQAQMKRVIQEFGARLTDSGGGATGLFYYAGHGLQVAGTNYLIPVQARIAREGDVDIEAVPVDLVMKQMAFADAGVNIVILDACRNNPLSRGFRSATRGLADPAIRPMGSFVAYSTAPGDVAEDGKGDNSAYTKALSEAITRPGASINDVFQEVRGKVLAATNRKQVPWDSSSLTAPFYFVPSEATVDPNEIELAFWDAIKDSKLAEDYQAYLTKYPDGAFAPLAQVRAKQLDPASGAVSDRPAEGAALAQSGENRSASIESAFWEAVETDRAVAGYRAYLDKFPQGQFVEQARARLAALDAGATTVAATQPAPLPEIVATNGKLYVSERARLRDAPSTASGTLDILAPQTALDATGRTADDKWWRVRLGDGRTAFIAASVVTDSPEQAAGASPAPVSGDAAICLKENNASQAQIAEACRRFIAAGIDDADDRYNAHLFLGNALFALDRHDEAIASYEDAIAVDPEFYGAHYRIGRVALSEERFADAQAAFQKAMALDPTRWAPVLYRGVVFRRQGDLDAALEDTSRAATLKPDVPEIYHERAYVHLARADLDAALADTERALKIDPTFWSPSGFFALYLSGRIDLALAMATRGAADNPDSFYWLVWKSMAERATGAGGDKATLRAARKLADRNAWWSVLLDYLDGDVTEDEARDRAKSAVYEVELDFYAGEQAVLTGNPAAARAALGRVAASRLYGLVEYTVAPAWIAKLDGS